MSDFGVCYKNGQRILKSETPYRVSDGHLQYKYAPLSALAFGGLALLPYETAKIVWYYLEILLLFGSFWISHKVLPFRAKGPLFVLGLGAAVLVKLIGRELELGQVNILIIFLLTVMLAAFLKKKDTAAGILWAVSLFFKPYALVFLPYFLLKKRIRIIASGAAATVLGLFLPVVVFGIKGNQIVLKEWVSTLSMSTPGLLAVGDNASLYAILLKHFPDSWGIQVKFLWLAVGLGTAVVFIWLMGEAKKRNLPSPEVLEAAFLFTLIPLFSPLGWYYTYLYALLAVIIILNALPCLKPAWRYILIADLVIIGGTLREVVGKDIFRFYTHRSLIAVNFLVIMAGLVNLRKRGIL